MSLGKQDNSYIDLTTSQTTLKTYNNNNNNSDKRSHEQTNWTTKREMARNFFVGTLNSTIHTI